MGIIDTIQNKKDQPLKAGSPNLLSLDKREIEFLLHMIKNSHFKGEDIELLYNLVLKIQKVYISYNK